MPTLQAGSSGAGCTPSLPARPRGLGSLLPYPGLVPPGGPTVVIKMGIEWGRGAESPHPFAALGLGPHPSGGPEAGGGNFRGWLFKTWFILIFIIFSVFP